MLSNGARVTGLGIAALLGAALVASACESGGSDDEPRGGSNSGGSSAGMAGSGGGGGSGESGGGGSGEGGGSEQVVTDCPGVDATAMITDFEMTPAAGGVFEWGAVSQGDMEFWGGTFNYPTTLSVTVAGGMLTAAGNVTEYAGFGLYVQNCADASSFAGVRFKIAGNPPMGKMRFALQTNQNEWATGTKGSCLAADSKKFIDCVHPSVEIDVTEDLTTVEIAWADLTGGKPASAATTNGSDMIGLQWILPWAEMGVEPYDVSVSIDDVELVEEGGGGTGAGGAGPGGAGGAGGVGGAG